MSDEDKKPVPTEKEENTNPSRKRREVEEARERSVRLTEKNPWNSAWKKAAVVAVVFLAIAAFGATAHPDRFAFAYLFAFQVALSVALGSVFFVLIQHLTSAGWSVTVRRTSEFFGSGLVIMFALFAPVWVMKERLYPWWNAENQPAHGTEHATNVVVGTTELTSQQHAGQQGGQEHAGQQGGQEHAGQQMGQEHAGAGVKHHSAEDDAIEQEEHHTMAKKRWWLNQSGFNIRAVLYFLVFSLLGWTLYRRSVSQDSSKDPKITTWLQGFSTVGTILFGLSLTFAGVDWIMSLEPMWFSTIFGVYLFAGSFVAGLATLILVTLGLRSSGILQKEINVEHFHDLGKLMFGFNVFWAYIGFSQMMLIWYAALPEETPFYHLRWYTDELHQQVGGWQMVSLSLLFLHFAAPFVFLISRNIKRRLPLLGWGSAFLLAMHVVDIYWLVMPNLREKYDIGLLWLDGACLIGVVGAYLAFVFHRMVQHPLIPVGDPRLARALHFENA